MASTLLLHGGYALPSYAQAASDPSAATHPEPTAVASATPALPGMAAVPVQTTPQTQIVNATALTGNTNLSVAPGQTLAINFGSQSTLNLTGNITNNGTIYAFSSNPAVTTATFAATNITNAQGALLSTMLPAGGLAGITSAVSNLNLSLVAVNNIINQGSIMSAGNLSMMAGGSITNALPQGITGPSPIMQAMNNLNMQASTITNSGLMAATTGNINILATLNSTLASSTVASTLAAIQNNNVLINNTNGVMQALNGVINVRDLAYIGKTDIAFNGGDVLSPNLNIYSGTGNIHVNTNHISGLVSGAAGALQIGTLSGKLSLGDWQLTGDPLIYGLGDVFVPTINTPNEALTIVAGGSIFISPGTYNVNKLFMQAGSNFTPNFDGMGNLTSLTINNGRSVTGGNIAEIGGGPTTFNVYASGAYAPFGTPTGSAPVVGQNVAVCTNCNGNYSVFVNANNLTVGGLPNGPTGNINLPNTDFVVGNGQVSFYASGGVVTNPNGANDHGFLTVGNITNYGPGVTIRGNLVRGTAQILPTGQMTDNSLAAIDITQNFSPVNIQTGNVYSAGFMNLLTNGSNNTGILGLGPAGTSIGFCGNCANAGPDYGAGAGNGRPFSLIAGYSVPFVIPPMDPGPPVIAYFTQQPSPQPNPPSVVFPTLPTLPPIGPPGPGPGPGPGGNPGAQPGTTPGTTTQQPPRRLEPIRITLDPRTNQQLLPPTTLPTDETPYYRPKYWWDSSDTSHSSDGLEQWVANDDGSETHLTKLQDDDGSWHWKDDNGQEWKPPEKILLAYSDDVDVIEDGKKMKFDLKATKDENVDSIKTKKDGYYDIRPKEPGFDIGHSPSDPSGQRDVPITHRASAETGWSPETSDTGGGGGNFNLPPTKIDSKDVPANPINNQKDYKDFTAQNTPTVKRTMTGFGPVGDYYVDVPTGWTQGEAKLTVDDKVIDVIKTTNPKTGEVKIFEKVPGNEDHVPRIDERKDLSQGPTAKPPTSTTPTAAISPPKEYTDVYSDITKPSHKYYVNPTEVKAAVLEAQNQRENLAGNNVPIKVWDAATNKPVNAILFVGVEGKPGAFYRDSKTGQPIFEDANRQAHIRLAPELGGGGFSIPLDNGTATIRPKALRLALRTVDKQNSNAIKTKALIVNTSQDTNEVEALGTVRVGKGAIAYIDSSSDSLSVYCLESQGAKNVTVTSKDGTEITIQPGKFVVLTAGKFSPEKVRQIAHRKGKSAHISENLTVFLAEFSIPGAIAEIAPLRRMILANADRHRQLVTGMLKNAVLLADLGKGDGVYKQSGR